MKDRYLVNLWTNIDIFLNVDRVNRCPVELAEFDRFIVMARSQEFAG
jgi:hypothetical protein